jgi:hypothetical protein
MCLGYRLTRRLAASLVPILSGHWRMLMIQYFIAPTDIITALRKMFVICDAYAEEYRISINTLKTKCLVVSPHSRRALFDRFEDCPFFSKQSSD